MASEAADASGGPSGAKTAPRSRANKGRAAVSKMCRKSRKGLAGVPQIDVRMTEGFCLLNLKNARNPDFGRRVESSIEGLAAMGFVA